MTDLPDGVTDLPDGVTDLPDGGADRSAVAGQSTELRSVQDLLADLHALVAGARSMPMSASCVVNREDVLALVEGVRSRLPHALVRAQDVLGDREAVLEQGRREAERIVASAAGERAAILAGTDVRREAQAEADRLLEQARAQALALRTQTEHYVDARLATFEIVLQRTLQAVSRGRDKLDGAHELDALRDDALAAERLDAQLLAAAEADLPLPG